VVIYDSLVNPKILKFCRPDTELVFVGKTMGQAHISQKEINKLLASKAKEGKTVARLKGGDPFVFGRGGEEAEAVVQNDIDIEIVPGVSSVTAVPAYGGVPITPVKLHSSSFNNIRYGHLVQRSVYVVMCIYYDLNIACISIVWIQSDCLFIIFIGHFASAKESVCNSSNIVSIGINGRLIGFDCSYQIVSGLFTKTTAKV